ncbi:MAG: outer membrane beta-barrel family protein, partial [Paramuribaculum sp.]|nr:outer membrane beta-barrel family protein [Paramuribaculum sp.]
SLFCLVFALVCAELSAKTIVIADKTDSVGIESATVVCSLAGDEGSKKLLSSDRGVVKLPDNTVKIQASRLGYEPVKTDMFLVGDTLFMTPNAWLREVTVKAERNNFKILSDRYIYDVSSDSTLRDLSTFEAFRKIPILNVNLNGQISSMQGKQLTYKVNGLIDPILWGDLQTALLSLKARHVSRIEIVENPNGDNPNLLEVNIITKGRLEGYQASFSGNVTDSYIRGSIWGMTKVRKFAIQGSYYYMQTRDHDTKTTSEEWRYNSPLRYLTLQKSKESGYRAGSNSFETSMSYNFDDLTILTASGRIILKVNPHMGSTSETEIFGEDMQPTAKYSYEKKDKIKDTEYEAHLEFEKLFGWGAKNGKLYLGYELYHRPVTFNTFSTFNIEQCDDASLMPDYKDYHKIHRSRSTMHTLMGDLRRVINERHVVNASVIYRYMDDNDADSLVLPHWERSKLNQNSASASVSYRYIAPKLTLNVSAGGRMYHDNISNTVYGDGFNFSRTSWTWYPSVGASYVPGGNVSYEAGYSLTAQVPDISALNPFVFRDIPGQLSYGNPNLKSEKIHTLKVGANFNLRRMYVGVTLSGQYATDLILQYRNLDNDNLLNITYGNIADRKTVTLSPFMTWRPFNATSVRLSAGVDYVKYRSKKLDLSNSGFQFYPNLTVSQELPWQLYLELSGRYNTKWIGLQGKGGENYGYGLTMVRSFMEQRLRVSLEASGFVPIYYNRSYSSFADNYYSQWTTRRFHANFSVRVSYRFGKLRATVQETESSISNDDIKRSYDE